MSNLTFSKNAIASPLNFNHCDLLTLELCQEIPAQKSFNSNLLQQGLAFYQIGQFAQAIEVWQQAESSFSNQDDRLYQALTLNYLSLAQQQLGQWTPAELSIDQALALLQPLELKTPDSQRLLAQVLSTQGRLQLQLGKAADALATLEQATIAYQQAGDEAGVTGSLLNQSVALQAQGLYRRATTILEELEQTLDEKPDSVLKAKSLRGLGNTFRRGGALTKSKPILMKSLKVAEDIDSPPDIAAAFLDLGNIERALAKRSGDRKQEEEAQAQTQAALNYYQQAQTQTIARTIALQAKLNRLSFWLATRPSQQEDASSASSTSEPSIPSKFNLLEKVRSLGEKVMQLQAQQWLAALEQSLANIRAEIEALPPGRTAISARINFASILLEVEEQFSLSKYQEAAQLLADAVSQSRRLGDKRAEATALGYLGGLYEKTQQWEAAEDLTREAIWLSQANNAPDLAYLWQWQLARILCRNTKTCAENRDEAIDAYGAAVESLQFQRQDLVAIESEVEYDFKERVEPIYRQYVALLLESEEKTEPSQEDLQTAIEVMEALHLAELDNFFRDACTDVNVEQPDIGEIDPTAAVIYSIILSDRLDVIVQLPNRPLRKSTSNPGSAGVKTEFLEISNRSLRHHSTRISQEAIEEKLKDLRRDTSDQEEADDNVPEDLQELQKNAQQVYELLIEPFEEFLLTNDVKTLVFVADGLLQNIPMAALYDGEHYLLENYAIAIAPALELLDFKLPPRDSVSALIAGAEDAESFKDEGFEALLGVLDELQKISQQVSRPEILEEENFLQESLQNQMSSVPFNALHIATHGKFSSNAEETFILDWDGRINVKALGDLLRAVGPGQFLELLVLSACETAKGDDRAALGLAGFALRSGAKSTVASLWWVGDDSTGTLMEEFYKRLNAKEPISKAEALRQSQLLLLENSEYKHPFFWAPFVLVGNWQNPQ